MSGYSLGWDMTNVHGANVHHGRCEEGEVEEFEETMDRVVGGVVAGVVVHSDGPFYDPP